jgi:heme exporter protein B
VISYIEAVWAIFRKDIALEIHTREVISSMLFFSLLVLVIFNFAFDLKYDELTLFTPGLLWVAFTFAGILGLNRSFLLEKEEGGIFGLMLSPVDRSAIYLGKVLSNFVFMLTVELLTAVVFLILYNYTPLYENSFSLIVIIFLGTLGFSVVGTLFSAITVNTKSREILLPLLFFPILVPIIIAAVSSTGIVLRGKTLGDASQWLKLMGAFDVLFLTLSVAVFEYVLEE